MKATIITDIAISELPVTGVWTVTKATVFGDHLQAEGKCTVSLSEAVVDYLEGEVTEVAEIRSIEVVGENVRVTAEVVI